jgi:hypothetical protein
MVPYKARYPEESGGDPHASAAYAASDAFANKLTKEEGHEIRLLDLPSCTPVQGAKPLVLGPGEATTALRAVTLRDAHQVPGSGAAGGATAVDGVLVPLLAVGTCTTLGEDYPCLGRILLYQLERTAAGGSRCCCRCCCRWSH